jgi:hypothetical protein
VAVELIAVQLETIEKLLIMIFIAGLISVVIIGENLVAPIITQQLKELPILLQEQQQFLQAELLISIQEHSLIISQKFIPKAI